MNGGEDAQQLEASSVDVVMRDQWSVAPFQPRCHRAQHRGIARTRDERPSSSLDFSEHLRQIID